MRRALATTIALCLLATLASTTFATAAEPQWSKLSPGMAELVQHGGYGNLPIEEVVRQHTPGDVYYLAAVDGGFDAAVAAIRRAGARVRFQFPEIRYVALVSPLAAVAAVSALPQVARLELDRIHDVQAITAQATATDFADQAKRGTSDVGADVLWEQGITGDGVRLGVTDTGIDSTHPDVGGSRLVGFADCTQVLPTFVLEEDAGRCQATPGYDDNGHGTHVAGIAAGGAAVPGKVGLYPGMAPQADIVGAKVCLAAGSCLNSSVMAGLRYLATDDNMNTAATEGLGADIVNVSLGSGRFYFSPISGAEQVTNNDPEARLVNSLAVDNNVLFTISAGNSGPLLQSTGSPAVASQVLAVGAAVADWDLDHPVDETAHGELGNIRPDAAHNGATGISTFSSRGPTGDRLVKPDVTAPGVYYIAAESAQGAEVAAADISHRHAFSTDTDYAVLSGTSMSAPAAAGAAALVWDGFRQFTGGDPAYYRLKAALANTAGGRAWEGSVVGLISGIRAKNLGEDPEELFPRRNEEWVGITGEGAGRIHAPSALLALTQGVTAYTPQVGELDDIHELQPSWALDDVAGGESRIQQFVFRGGPGLSRKTRMTFDVESGHEPTGVHSAPVSWFKLPNKAIHVSQSAETLAALKLEVPTTAAPGMYASTIVATAKLGPHTTQRIRIPVTFFVPIADEDAAEGSGASIEGPIWAEGATDYSAIGFQAGDILTDWTMLPLRIPAGTQRVDLSVYDVAGKDHMDFFVFNGNGEEVDSTVSRYLHHATPGDLLYAPTTHDGPAKEALLDGDDFIDLVLPATVWIAVSDSGPAEPAEFSTYHLDVDIVGDAGGGGAVPAPLERIHSGEHAWWSGSTGDADSHVTRSLSVPANAAGLRFWTWYQLEDGFDWAYALVSNDGGATWTSLETTAENGSGTTPLDPIGTIAGIGGNKTHPNGFTGTSGVPPLTGFNLLEPIYVEQVADISSYAGETILLRFAYTSDPAVNLENFYVDDVSLTSDEGMVLFSDDIETFGPWTPGGTPGFAWVTAQPEA